MKRILVLYYSRTGNTEKMAEAVAEGAKSINNVEVELKYHIDAGSLGSYDAIIVGSPTYDRDMPIDFKKLFEEAEVKGINLKGKIGAAFGSYGWSGEAPKLIVEIMKNKFEMNISRSALLAKYMPNQEMLNDCKSLGVKVSESLMNQA